mmetsp:Transcript_62573/g.182963  ORF Transcript_62573/g.182963 Transcript_62573/m.182963 type:complete len:281 (+) Transcript_62573:63-905(+)
MDIPGVDWELVDQQLPTAQIPSAKAERDALFAGIDTSNNGFITLSEANGGIPPMLECREARKRGEVSRYLVPIKDFRPAIKAAFLLAKKVAPPTGTSRRQRSTHDTCVDRREFHALLVAFRTYIELSVLFQALDQDDYRGWLNWKECSKALPLLEKWGISEKQAKSKFPDDWTPHMGFAAFANWCITCRFGHLELELDTVDAEASLKDAAGDGDILAMVKAFHDWDIDGSGTISADELADVLVSLDPSFTRDDALKLFEAADANKDGNVDYLEFTNWVTK